MVSRSVTHFVARPVDESICSSNQVPEFDVYLIQERVFNSKNYLSTFRLLKNEQFLRILKIKISITSVEKRVRYNAYDCDFIISNLQLVEVISSSRRLVSVYLFFFFLEIIDFASTEYSFHRQNRCTKIELQNRIIHKGYSTISYFRPLHSYTVS